MKYYQEPRLPTHAQADSVLGLALQTETPELAAAEALIGLALADPDQEFVEQWCVRVGCDALSFELRGTAALAIGHLARRFGRLSPGAKQLVVALAADGRMVAANAQVLDALDDVRQFAPEDH